MTERADCHRQSPQLNTAESAAAPPDSASNAVVSAAPSMASAEPATPSHDPSRPTVVYAIGVTIYSLSDVDPLNGRFVCDFKVSE